jgi:chromosome segregation ATPase
MFALSKKTHNIEKDIYIRFAEHVDDLARYDSYLNPAQFGFLLSAKLLSNMLQTEIPAGEDINIEGRKKCHENDLIKSQMESNDESLTEKRIRVATYEEEQSNLAGQIQFHEQELQRLHARDHELAEKIKADKECILSQEGLRKKFSDDLAVCARSIRELSDKQYQQRWKTRSDLQHLIRLLQDD